MSLIEIQLMTLDGIVQTINADMLIEYIAVASHSDSLSIRWYKSQIGKEVPENIKSVIREVCIL